MRMREIVKQSITCSDYLSHLFKNLLTQKKMDFSFTIMARLDLTHKKGEATSKHMGLSFTLIPSNNLDAKQYVSKEGMPTKEGHKIVSDVLVSSLAACIHSSHQHGYMDSAEHLRKIIKGLEEQFVMIAEVKKSTM